MIFYRIQPEKIEPDDIRWLSIACLSCKWDKTLTPANLVQRAIDGDISLYRVISKQAHGIIALKFMPEQDQLWIETYAGKGLMRVQQEFRDMLGNLARSSGLKKIAGFVSRDALAKYYDRYTRGKPVATLYIEEV